MDYDFFLEKLNSTFEIHFAPEHIHSAVLTEVNRLKDVPGQMRAPFNLLFLTNLTDHYFGQGVYTLSCPDSEPLQIFLVPIGTEKATGQVQYEAVFN